MAATIPDDLLIEILSRLPTKSLQRFQCVSKLWTNIITHISSQRTTLLPMSGFFYFYGTTGFYVPTAPEPLQFFKDGFKSRLTRFDFYSKSFLIDSCNGLLLFEKSSDYLQHKVYYVCNPATNEFVTLPDSPLKGHPSSCLLAFDPRDSPHYKVVRFFNHYNNSILVEMYSSLRGRWARFIWTSTFDIWFLQWVFHNRVLHMITWKNDLLVCFHTDRVSFRRISLPEKPSGLEREWIGESRGRLYYARQELHELQIYMLDEQCSDEWLPIHHVKEGPLFFRPIAFHPELELICICIPGKILSYHLSSRKFEEVICCKNDCYMVDKIFRVIPCLESLNPPGGRFISAEE